MQAFAIIQIALALSLSLGGGLAQAQGGSPATSAATGPAVSPELAARLERQGTVRVRTHGGWVELSQPRLSEHAGLAYLTARPFDPEVPVAELPRPLPFAEISEIQLRKSAAGRGALVGGVLAGGVAMVAALPAVAVCGQMGAGEPCGIGDFIGAVTVVAACGAGIGALIGAATKRWTTVYREP